MTGVRNTGNVLPNPDAVDQFRVDTNNSAPNTAVPVPAWSPH